MNMSKTAIGRFEMNVLCLTNRLAQSSIQHKIYWEQRELSKALVSVLVRNMKRALSRGDLAEAGDILSRLQKEDPLSRETRGFELEYCLLSDRLDEAQRLSSQLCRMFPDSARIWLLAGKVAYRQKRYVDAETSFRESHRLYSSDQTELWLGKTLTQMGRLDEAESLLTSVRTRLDQAWLALGWLYERKADLDAALFAYESYARLHPDHSYAAEQIVRVKARALDPDSLIEEVERRADFGEEITGGLYSEYVEKLLETGQGQRAREEVRSGLDRIDSKTAVRIAWSCYRRQIYDLATDLFLRSLEENTSNVKYLTALESAAAKCNRIAEVAEAYERLTASTPRLYGRLRTLKARLNPN
jgi:tetratricopeptide (TPR) repeat protein